MRFKLTVRDGRVFTGEIVGEAGPAILFRDNPDSGLLSIPLTELTGAVVLDEDLPLKVSPLVTPESAPYYEINESLGDLVVTLELAYLKKVRAVLKGSELILRCTCEAGSSRMAIPLPVKTAGSPIVRMGERVVEIFVPLS